MNAERLMRLRETAEWAKEICQPDSQLRMQARDTLELLEYAERLRGAIVAHREVHCDLDMPCPNDLRWANRQLWATVAEK